MGLDYRALLSRNQAQCLRSTEYLIRPYEPSDLPFWMETYERRCAHFIRPLDDWNWALETRLCQSFESEFLSVTLDGTVCGYTVSYVSSRDGACVIAEYAGDTAAILSVLGLLMERHDTQSMWMHVQGTQIALLDALARAGVRADRVHSKGTLLVLNFPQLIERVRPWIASRAGMNSATAICVREEDGHVRIQIGNEGIDFASRADATEFVFGNHERGRGQGVFARVFPVPSLWYGLNYV